MVDNTPEHICNSCKNECKNTHLRKECVLFVDSSTERKRIEKMLRDTFEMGATHYDDTVYSAVAVADMWLADRKSCLEAVKKPLEEVTQCKIGSMYYQAYLEEGNVFCKAIAKALAEIERMTK